MGSEKTTIALATGGTGGHLFPAISLGEYLVTLGYDVHFILGTSDTQKLKALMPLLSFGTVHVIETHHLEGGFRAKLKKGIKLLGAGLKAFKLLSTIKPHTVVGFGSYATVPTVKVAQLMGIPTVLHEQNCFLGKANRLLARGARKIAVSFPDIKGLRAKDMAKVVYTGNPVRSSIRALREAPYPPFDRGETIHLLVFGGSQGAKAFNDVVPEAIALLPQEMRGRFSVVQQAQGQKASSLKSKYEVMNVSADIVPFIHDMDVQIEKAHLVICRSGASTVSELTTAGRPAIYVPYPYATDNHQMMNAQFVEKNGGGWILPAEAFTAEALAAKLETLLRLPQLLSETATRAKGCGRAMATENVYMLFKEYVENQKVALSQKGGV